MRINKVFYGVLLIQLNIFMLTGNVYASTVNDDNINCESSIEIRADKIDWQYKTVNGILYRRLYNYTTKKPVSDWEIVT
ncbi:hypothetical protein MR857_12475 [bacterium]|nr:hypothetical protein [bacterium]